MSMSMTPIGTLYWRAIRRTERRVRAYQADPTFEGWILMCESVRTTNRLAHRYLGPRDGCRNTIAAEYLRGRAS